MIVNAWEPQNDSDTQNHGDMLIKHLKERAHIYLADKELLNYTR